GDPKLVEQAMDDIRQAKFRVGDNMFVLHTSLMVHLRAADLYGEPGQAEKRKAGLVVAGAGPEALKDFPGSKATQLRGSCFKPIGNEEAAFKLLEQAVAHDETNELVWAYALALYRKNQVEKALDVLDRVPPSENASVQFLRLCLMAEHPKYGREKAYQSFRELMARHQREPGTQQLHVMTPFVPLFLGDRPGATAAIGGLGRDFKVPGTEGADMTNITNFVARKMTEEQYLESVIGSRCVPYFLAGLVRLSEGDSKGALDQFQKSVDTKWFVSWAYGYSRIFLERLQRDPTWPTWIPAKK